MKPKEILTGAVKLNLALDADKVMSEIHSSSKLDFVETLNAKRGPIHRDVNSCWIRGSTSQAVFPPETNDLLEEVPTLKKFLGTFPASLGRVLVANLKAGGKIPVHIDQNKHDSYFEETIRFHVPLKTNPDVTFFNTGKSYKMKKGEVWAIYNNGKHAVNNNGNEDRYHVVFDFFINNEIAELVKAGDHNLDIKEN